MAKSKNSTPRLTTLLNNQETLARSWSIQTNQIISELAIRVSRGLAAAHGAGRSLGSDVSVRMFIEYAPTLIAHILAVKGANETYLFGSENAGYGVYEGMPEGYNALPERRIDGRPCQLRQYSVERQSAPSVKEHRNTFEDELEASRAIATAIASMAFAYSSVRQQSFPALDDPDWPVRLVEYARKLIYEADVRAIRYEKWEKREVLELGNMSAIYDWWNNPAHAPDEPREPYPTRPARYRGYRA